jgi:predicted AAA+ superfamily ATPase
MELSSIGIPLIYWQNDNTAEIDFIMETKDGIIPIEVKAGTNIRSKSLAIYMEKYNPEYSIRISAKNFGFENRIRSVPLYATFCLEEYIGLEIKHT